MEDGRILKTEEEGRNEGTETKKKGENAKTKFGELREIYSEVKNRV